MCRFLLLRRGKFPTPQLRSQRLSRTSVSDRTRKFLLGHLTPFVICERVHRAEATRRFSSRPAGPFLRGKAARILVQARRRAVRCYRPADEYPEGDARCRARCRFPRRYAVAGPTRPVSAVILARTKRDGRSKD